MAREASYLFKRLRVFSINIFHSIQTTGLETYASPDVLQKRRESRESGWVNNFQLSEEEKTPKRQSSAYSVSKSPSRSLGNGLKT